MLRRIYIIVFLILPSAFAAAETLKLRKQGQIRIYRTVSSETESAPSAVQAEPSEETQLEKSEFLDKKRSNLERTIKRYLKQASNAQQRNEILLRLASLYIDEYRANLAGLTDPKRAKKHKGEKVNSPLQKAAAIYREMMAKNVHHEKRDQMLYFLGQASMNLNNLNEAKGYYQRLLSESPGSAYAAPASVELGDLYFNNNEFARSERYYDLLVRSPEPRFQSYGLYKKAWAEFNLGRHRESVTLFKRTLNVEGESTLTAEVLKDICTPLSELNDPKEAIRFFQAQDTKRMREGLENVATLYSIKNKTSQVVYLYEYLQSRFNSPIKKLEYEHDIIEAYYKAGNRADAVNRLLAHVSRYMGSPENDETDKDFQRTKDLWEKSLRKFALETHADGQKTKKEALYQNAKQLYRKYLEFFAGTTAAPEIKFNLAEILYREKNFEQAAPLYYQAFETSSSQTTKQAALKNSLLALNQEINKSGKSLSAQVAAINQQSLPAIREYTNSETLFTKVAKKYLKQYPSTKEAADIEFGLSLMKYTHGNLPEAIQGFQAQIRSAPGTENSYLAARLILDSYNKQQDLPSLVRASREFLGNAKLARADFRREVSDVLRHSELKAIQTAKGDDKEMGEKYLSYLTQYQNQDSNLDEKAYYNAIVHFQKANATSKNLPLLEDFARRFPTSKLNESVILELGQAHEALSHFGKAAQYYGRFAQTYPTSQNAANAARLAKLYAPFTGTDGQAFASIDKVNALSAEDARARGLYERVAQKRAGFEAITLTSAATLEKKLAQKLKLLKSLEQNYNDVVKTGSPQWGLAAIYQIASLYDNVAGEVIAAPIPKGLSAEETEKYRKGVADSIAEPMAKKAMQYAEECVKKAEDFAVFSEWGANCYRLASKKDSEHYPLVPIQYLPAVRIAIFGEETQVKSLEQYPHAMTRLSRVRIPALASTMTAPFIYGDNQALKQALAEKYERLDKNSLSALNLLRVLNPKNAIVQLHQQLEATPKDPALLNLLALAYLENNEIAKASSLLTSLTEQKPVTPAIWNNLGTIALLLGKEKAAIQYFVKATEGEGSREANSNLGFLALKYRNGAQAKKFFETALALSKVQAVSDEIGKQAALIVKGELGEAAKGLEDILSQFQNDPYAQATMKVLQTKSAGRGKRADTVASLE